MGEKIRKTWIDIMGEFSWGTHICQFYQTKDDLIDILVPYFKAGLENNEFCMWVTSEPLNEREAKKAMRNALPDFDRYLKTGQIEIISHAEWYLKDGAFDLQKVLKGWVDKLNQALAKGYDGMRVTGNTAWLEKRDWRKFADYEEEINNMIGKYRMMAICTYSLDKCGAAEIVDVVRNHQFALIRWEGKWECIESSDRKKAEEMLRESEERYRAIFEQAANSILLIDAETGALVEFNGRAHESLGYTREEFQKLKIPDFEVIESREEVAKHIEKIISEGADTFETKHRRKDGEIRDIQVNCRAISIHGRDFIQGIWLDITERERAKEALAGEKERLGVTLRSIGDGVISTDTEGKIILINRMAEELTGWSQEEAIGKPVNVVFHTTDEKTGEPSLNLAENVMEKGAAVEFVNKTALITRDGTEIIIADRHTPILDKDGEMMGMVVAFHDITEERKMEEELLRAQKLESVGILAGGIAHDFNNYLTAILGNIALARMNANAEDPISEILREAEKASLLARDLTNQLLTFSKGAAPNRKTASIEEIIRNTARFGLRGSNVLCEFSIPDDLWQVEIDEGQISQVIDNLVINADQAMPEGGKIEIRAENVLVKPEYNIPLKEGEYVKVSIKDYGIGIAKEHLPKVFDPFFTTKPKSSGLGLATAYSIIKKHDGYITVESELGVGATFYIYLPTYQKEIQTRRAVGERLILGKGKILVMDDEVLVRKVTGRMLEHIGYEVSFTKDGAEAIEIYKQAKESGNPFDAVIMDLTIPGGMGGKEAVKRLLEIDPEAKVIISSGYANDPIIVNFRQYGFSAFVAKPYRIEELSDTLHTVIDRGNE